MRIAIIPSGDLSYESGSVIYAKNLFRFLHRNGHQAFLLGKKLPAGIANEHLPFITIRTDLLEHPVIDDRPVSSLEYGTSLGLVVDYLLRLNDRARLDLIHAHYGSFTSFAANIVHGLTGIPYIVSSFGRDVTIGMAHDPRLKWLIERSFPEASMIVVADDSLKAHLRKILPTRKYSRRILAMPMPMDQAVLETGDLQLAGASPTIATINSCFSPEKGIDTILDAFARVVALVDCRLVIAGQDDHPDQAHRKRLVDHVRDLRISSRVIFSGYLSRPNVGNLLRASSFVVDARNKGNFSSVLLEAMFTNTPVLASRNKASARIIRDGFNGLFFEPNDSAMLQQRMLKCLQDHQLLARLKRNTAEWVKSHGHIYSEETCFARLLSAYNEAILET